MIFAVGTLCEIKQILKMPGSSASWWKGQTGGSARFSGQEGYYEATITVPEADEMDERPESEGAALVRAVHDRFRIRP